MIAPLKPSSVSDAPAALHALKKSVMDWVGILDKDRKASIRAKLAITAICQGQ
ncbi:MAG: hypothetical protein V3T77_03805 [Planctomycetota bacterium]